MIKKICSWLLVMALFAAALVAAARERHEGDENHKRIGRKKGRNQYPRVDVRIAALKGPRQWGMVKLMDDVDKGGGKE